MQLYEGLYICSEDMLDIKAAFRELSQIYTVYNTTRKSRLYTYENICYKSLVNDLKPKVDIYRIKKNNSRWMV